MLVVGQRDLLLLDLSDPASWLGISTVGLPVSCLSTRKAVASKPRARLTPLTSSDPEAQCWEAATLPNGIHGSEVLHLIFLHLDLLIFLIAQAGHKHAAVLFLIQDGLDITGQLDRFFNLGWAFLQNLVPDVLFEPSREDRVHNEKLHPLQALAHDLVGLCLVGSKRVSYVGDDMIRLLFVRVPERFRNSVVEGLDIFLTLLFEVLKGDAQRFGRKLGRIRLEELLLDLGPVVDVEPDDVLQRGRPLQGFISEREEELIAFQFVRVPMSHSGSSFQPLNELLWCDGVLLLDAVRFLEQQHLLLLLELQLHHRLLRRLLHHHLRRLLRGVLLGHLYAFLISCASVASS